jgi:hypothetical protein
MRAPGRTTINFGRRMGRWASSVEDKLWWLENYGDMFHSKEEMVKAMKVAGVLSKTTYWRDFKLERYLELINERKTSSPRHPLRGRPRTKG